MLSHIFGQRVSVDILSVFIACDDAILFQSASQNHSIGAAVDPGFTNEASSSVTDPHAGQSVCGAWASENLLIRRIYVFSFSDIHCET